MAPIDNRILFQMFRYEQSGLIGLLVSNYVDSPFTCVCACWSDLLLSMSCRVCWDSGPP